MKETSNSGHTGKRNTGVQSSLQAHILCTGMRFRSTEEGLEQEMCVINYPSDTEKRSKEGSLSVTEDPGPRWALTQELGCISSQTHTTSTESMAPGSCLVNLKNEIPKPQKGEL